MSNESPTLRLYRSFARFPGGKWLFACAVCWRAPYFSSIRPQVVELERGRSVWRMRKRRAVQNHLGTVHALAMGNLCEIAAGLVMEASVPTGKRWIPKGMQIDYLRKATTDVSAEAAVAADACAMNGDVPVEVAVRDAAGEMVVRAVITMYVSAKRVA